jgi:hypothetical protein
MATKVYNQIWTVTINKMGLVKLTILTHLLNEVRWLWPVEYLSYIFNCKSVPFYYIVQLQLESFVTNINAFTRSCLLP